MPAAIPLTLKGTPSIHSLWVADTVVILLPLRSYTEHIAYSLDGFNPLTKRCVNGLKGFGEAENVYDGRPGFFVNSTAEIFEESPIAWSIKLLPEGRPETVMAVALLAMLTGTLFAAQNG